MIFKTIYRFRVRVQEEHDTGFPLHLCVHHNKFPLFNDLVSKIQQFVKNIADYHITIDKKYREQYHRDVLHDDHTLRNALISLSDHDRLEILLCRKYKAPSDYFHKSNETMYNEPERVVPVIKPTVIRFHSVPQVPMQRPREDSVQSFPDTSSRKDSGISFDGVVDDMDDKPVAKKQRVMSADESMPSRKLPELSTRFCFGSPPPHPLDCNVNYRRASSPITLPSLSCLSPPASAGPLPHTPQLAPIHPRFYPTGLASTSPTLSPPLLTPPSSALPQQNTAPGLPPPPSSTSTSSTSSCVSVPILSLPVAKIKAKRTSLPPSPRSRSQPRQAVPKTSSNAQFLCEHVVDPATGRVCGQTFRRSYDLSRHQAIHLKNRPFCYCLQCGKKFTRLDALRRHERVQGHDAENRRVTEKSQPPPHHHHTSSRHTGHEHYRAQRVRV